MDIDARLCTNFGACRSYQSSYKDGLQTCSGCEGDISGHRLLSQIVDKYLNPVISTVLTTDQNETMTRFIQAAGAIRIDLAENAGMDVEPQEVGLLIGLRLMQRVVTLETEARVRARRR